MPKKKSPAFDKLTVKQRLFIIHYMESFNAYKAAKEAGYKGGYNTVSTIGIQNLQKPTIKAAIQESLEKLGITPQRVKSEIAQIAMSADLADFEPWLEGKKTLRQLRAMGIDTRLVSGATKTVGEDSVKRQIKLLDRQKALTDLTKILGITEEVRRIKGGEDIGKNSGKILTIQFERAEKPESMEGKD